jgi:hypothetical protein
MICPVETADIPIETAARPSPLIGLLSLLCALFTPLAMIGLMFSNLFVLPHIYKQTALWSLILFPAVGETFAVLAALHRSTRTLPAFASLLICTAWWLWIELST